MAPLTVIIIFIIFVLIVVKQRVTEQNLPPAEQGLHKIDHRLGASVIRYNRQIICFR